MITKMARLFLFAGAIMPVILGCTSSYAHTDRPGTQIRFGIEVARKGYWREAAFRFEQAIALNPKSAEAHNNFAVSLEATGNFAQALEEYKRALELAPNNAKIKANYARFAEFYTSYTRTTGKAAPDAR